MKKKHTYNLYFLVALQFVIIGYLLYQTKEEKPQLKVNDGEAAELREGKARSIPRVRIFDLPDKPEFAGEKVPIDQPDVFERYEREIYVNAYWES